MSLRVKINILITLLMLVFIGSTTAIQLRDTKQQIQEEITAGTKVANQLLPYFLARAQLLSLGKDREDALKNFLKNLGRIRAHEVRMFNSIGDLIYDSPPSKYKAGRNAPKWFSNLVSPKIEPFIIPAQALTVQVTPNPSRAILDAWDDLRELAILGLFFFIFVNLLVFWIIGKALNPIKDIVNGLHKMQKGDFQTRLPSYSVTEFSSVTAGFNQMANAIEQGLKENRKLALAIEQSTDALIIADKTGMVIFANPAAEKLFRYFDAAFLGIHVENLFPLHLHEEMERKFFDVQNSVPIENYDTTRITRFGKIIEVSEKISPIIEPVTNDVLGVLLVMRDIKERRVAEKTKRELEKNKELAVLVQSRLEEERKALAMELHDELGQYVTAIKSIAQSMANQKDELDVKIYNNSKTIVSISGQIYDAVHNIIKGLRPISLEEFGFIETLEEAVEDWQTIHENITFNLKTEPMALPREVEISLFRVVQECVNNAVKHSGAKNITITLGLSKHSGDLALSVADDGKGISSEKINQTNRFGLRGMRDRIQSLGGKFIVESPSGSGTKIFAIVPSAKIKDIE